MNLSLDEKKYWLAYKSDENLDWQTIRALAKEAGCLKLSWGNHTAINKLNFRPSIKERIKLLWQKLDVDKLLKRFQKRDSKMVAIIESGYPKMLAEVSDPPFLIFYRGDIQDLDNSLVLSSVGTRKPTNYGLSMVGQLVGPVASRGVVIVSGLAYGIDESSHKVCLKVGGRTVAVLGGGIDQSVIYPASNRRLASKIVESGGAIVSEYLPWQTSEKRYFVARNRIIAGLSQAVLITEAGEKSGSLITADFALEEGREIFVLPGNVDSSKSVGSNSLIKEGANPVTEANDLLDYFGLGCQTNDSFDWANLSKTEIKVGQLLRKKPLSADEIIAKINLDAGRLSAILSNMEIKGIAKRDRNIYRINR